MKPIERLKQRLKEKMPALDLEKMKDSFLEKKLRADRKILKRTQLDLFSFHGVKP